MTTIPTNDDPQRPMGDAVSHAMGRAIESLRTLEATQQQWLNYPGLLPDFMIRHLCLQGMIQPFAEGEKRPGKISYGITSTGYDIRLGTKYKLFNHSFVGIIDVKNLNPEAFINREGDYLDIPGGGYALGESVEFFKIPRDITCLVLGKSTYARVGLTINVTPGEPEWEGRWTVEMENASPAPIRVYANEGIAQVMFIRAIAPCTQSYKDKAGKYQGDAGVRLAVVDQTPVLYECWRCEGKGRLTNCDGLLTLTCNVCKGEGKTSERSPIIDMDKEQS